MAAKQASTDILLLPGDGIGPEVTASATQILSWVKTHHIPDLTWQEQPLGGASIDVASQPITEETLSLAKQAKGVLLGAVGGPAWDHLPMSERPEKGLLKLRKHLGCFANLRPAILYPELVDASTLKPDVVSGLDLLIVRELTGGIYFGEPRGVSETEGERFGYNTYRYTESEVRRIAKVAFEAAMRRNKKLCSVDKANVLEVTRFWREIIEGCQQEYPEVEVSHMYVDNAAMQLVRNPKQFDVMVTGNMFGDILSDEAAMLTGSIGMLPSASLNEYNQGIYEPCHGSAPDIAGLDQANPLAMILSCAMMFRFSFENEPVASAIELAVQSVLSEGWRTQDIALSQSDRVLGTQAMAAKVMAALSTC